MSEWMIERDDLICAQDFESDAFRKDPYPLYAKLRKHHPVYHDRLHNLFHVTRYNDIVFALRNEELFGTRPHSFETDGVLGPTMLSLGGTEHARERNLVADALMGRKLDSFAPIVREVAKRLVNGFVDRGEVNLTKEFTSQLPIRVIMRMLGLPETDFDLFARWYQQFMVGMGWDDRARAFAHEAVREYEEYMTSFLANRRRDLSDDLTSRLLKKGLSDQHIKTFVSLLLAGGGETTDKAMGNMWWNLLQQPELLAKVEAAPSFIDNCLTETMRHSPPVHREDRHAVVNVDLAGVTIPAGANVRLWLGSGNRDETVFANPDVFDPFRRDLFFGKDLRAGYDQDGRVGHLGFGLGRHHCIGNQLARREAVIGSEELLKRCKTLRLIPGASDSIKARKVGGSSIRSVGDLRVAFDPR